MTDGPLFDKHSVPVDHQDELNNDLQPECHVKLRCETPPARTTDGKRSGSRHGTCVTLLNNMHLKHI